MRFIRNTFFRLSILRCKSLILLGFLCSIALITSCAKEIKSEESVYFNDFESGDLSNITDGKITEFNGTKVIGRYNLGGFNLYLDNLPVHDLIEVSFDLYIHDSWDGNMQRVENDSGPDIWKFIADNEIYINTTFSNSGCAQFSFCDPQSYPYNYQNNSTNPRTGAEPINLPGACFLSDQPNGTTMYKINKRFIHKNRSIKLEFLDELKQTNASDPLCDESWSMDNVEIKIIRL